MAASTASQIIEAIGGAGNVKSLTHCATRLRFELVDAGKVDQHRLETMKGVLGAVPQSGDRYQVVIGGAVATMYENIMHLPRWRRRRWQGRGRRRQGAVRLPTSKAAEPRQGAAEQAR